MTKGRTERSVEVPVLRGGEVGKGDYRDERGNEEVEVEFFSLSRKSMEREDFS